MLTLASIIAADTSAVFSDLPEKILTQCGLVTAVLVVAIVWLASQLHKAHAGWEADRAGMLKTFNDQSTAYERMAAAHAKLEGIVLAMQVQRGADDD